AHRAAGGSPGGTKAPPGKRGAGAVGEVQEGHPNHRRHAGLDPASMNTDRGKLSQTCVHGLRVKPGVTGSSSGRGSATWRRASARAAAPRSVSISDASFRRVAFDVP